MTDKNDDLDEEIRTHLDMSVRDRMDRGASREEAESGAKRELGNVALVKEVTREMWGWMWLERLVQDVRYAGRLMRRSSGFTLVALLSLTLGIGVNTAIFQVINAVRLRALPVGDPSSLALVRIADMTGARGSFNSRYPSLTNPIWEAFRREQQAFSSVLAWNGTTFNLSPGGLARPVRGLWVSGSFFNVLSVRPAAGRLFAESDDQRGCEPRVVVSYGFWNRELGRRQIVGTTLTVQGHPVEIIGVAAEGFTGVEVGRSFDVAVPICAEPALSGGAGRLDAGTDWWLAIMGRLKPGSSIEQASAHLAAISPALFRTTIPSEYPAVNRQNYLGFRLEAAPGGSGVSGLREDYSDPLWLLLATGAVVLVIACVNLASLMLARATAREREFAVRLSLGASRGRVIRQLLIESLVLACLGALGGSLIARNLSASLVAFLDPDGETISLALGTDWRVLAFTIGAAALTCLLFGLIPAIRATRLSVAQVARTASRGLTAGRERFVLRRALVTLQVALSLMLLIGAVLFARTLSNLLAVDPGFRSAGVVAAAFDLRPLHIEMKGRHPVQADLLARVRAVAGVRAAAQVAVVPASGNSWGNNVWMERAEPAALGNALFNRISEGYFKTLDIPILAGRDFSEADNEAAPAVAIVNDTFVTKIANGRNPIGQRFKVEATPSRPETAYEIVGVVRDAKYIDLRQEPYPVVFVAARQAQQPNEFLQLVVGSDLGTAALTAGITEAIRQFNPAVIVSYTDLETLVQGTLIRERLMATLSGFFGVLAALLAVIGLYGVIAYTVVRRTNEIGVRIALGATRPNVIRMIMSEAFLLIAAGLVIGTSLALAAGRAAATLLFGLEPNDPGTVAMSIVTLAVVALAAAYWPAARAAAIEPTAALRVE
jgi:putative ABC transport system permease protein